MLKHLIEELIREDREIVDVFKIPIPDRWYILGTFKLREFKRKNPKAFVLSEFIEFELQSLYNIEYPIIPSDVSKAILLFLSQLENHKITFSRETLDRLLNNEIYHPLYANPTRIENAVYIDLSSAYYTIVKAYFPCQYKRNSYLSIPRSVRINEEEFLSKIAKVSTISLARQTHALLVRKSNSKTEFKHIKRKNQFLNDIVAFVYDYLHALAKIIIAEAGAEYVHTDGYIIPEQNLRKAEDILSNYWIGAWKIKARGEVIIKASGTYRFIGNISSKHFDKISESRIDNIYMTKEEARFLLETVKRHKIKYL
jgi:hypothetical protein